MKNLNARENLANTSKGENIIKFQDMEKEGISIRKIWHSSVCIRTRESVAHQQRMLQIHDR